MFPIIKVKLEDNSELLLNINNIAYIKRAYNATDYNVYMRAGPHFSLTWKEYERLDKALQTISENES